MVSIDIEFFKALKGLLGEFIKINAKSFAFGGTRGVPFESEAYFVQGVFIVVNKQGGIAVVGIPILFQEHLVERIRVNPQLNAMQFAVEHGTWFGVYGRLSHGKGCYQPQKNPKEN